MWIGIDQIFSFVSTLQVNDFVSISDRVYNNEQILSMENTILGRIEWNITVLTPYMFLARFIKAHIPDDEVIRNVKSWIHQSSVTVWNDANLIGFTMQLESMVYFLSELALMNYTTLVYCPSMVAASAVYVARHILHKSPAWTETLMLHTNFTESQLM